MYLVYSVDLDHGVQTYVAILCLVPLLIMIIINIVIVIVIMKS